MVKILIVCSSRAREEGYFIHDQVSDLEGAGYDTGLFFMRGRGVIGYISSWLPLIRRILTSKPDIVHAHYGLSAFIAVMQPFCPVVMTVHGGDVHDRRNSWLTRIACRLAAHVITVNSDMPAMTGRHKDVSVLPCGVSLSRFYPVDRREARAQLGMSQDDVVILFASAFDRKVKNAALAQEAVAMSEHMPVLLEIRDRTRDEMPMLINAADVVLLTSHYEGSPQIIKEAMACNVPVVSTDVGDIRLNGGDLEGHFICGFDAAQIALSIDRAVVFRRSGRTTGGRERIMALGLDSDSVTKRLTEIFAGVIKKYSRRWK